MLNWLLNLHPQWLAMTVVLGIWSVGSVATWLLIKSVPCLRKYLDESNNDSYDSGNAMFVIALWPVTIPLISSAVIIYRLVVQPIITGLQALSRYIDYKVARANPTRYRLLQIQDQLRAEECERNRLKMLQAGVTQHKIEEQQLADTIKRLKEARGQTDQILREIAEYGLPPNAPSLPVELLVCQPTDTVATSIPESTVAQ